MRKLLAIACLCVVFPAFAQNNPPKLNTPPPKPAEPPLFAVDTAAQTAPAANSALARILKKLHIRVCVRSDVPPFGQFSSRGLSGFDISLASDLVTRLSIDYKKSLHIDWVVITARNRVPYLQRNVCDLVVASFSSTPDRAKKVGLSKVYAQTDKVLIAANKITRTTPVIARVRGTTGEFGDLKGTIKEFSSYQAIIYAMENGTVDYVVADQPIAVYMMRSVNQTYKISKVLAKNAEQYVVGVKKENADLLDAVNRALQDLAQSGQLAHLHRKWL